MSVSTEMKCRMPNLLLDKDFLAKLAQDADVTVSNGSLSAKRRKRHIPVKDIVSSVDGGATAKQSHMQVAVTYL